MQKQTKGQARSMRNVQKSLAKDIKKTIVGEDKDMKQDNYIILTKELIHAGKTDKGGFTSAQIEYLGFCFGEKWIDRCIGKKLTQKEYLKFLSYKLVDAKQLKSLKKNNEFKGISHDNA